MAGPVPPNPAEMLDSEPMRELLREADEQYDLVVIDAPPSTVVPDAIPILQQVSAVLVVARAGTTTRDEAAELSSQLRLLDAPLVGVVANYAADAARLWLLLRRRANQREVAVSVTRVSSPRSHLLGERPPLS